MSVLVLSLFAVLCCLPDLRADDSECPLPVISCKLCITSVDYQRAQLAKEDFVQYLKQVLHTGCMQLAVDEDLCTPFTESRFEWLNATTQKHTSKEACAIEGFCTRSKFQPAMTRRNLCNECAAILEDFSTHKDDSSYTEKFNQSEFQKCMKRADDDEICKRYQASSWPVFAKALELRTPKEICHSGLSL